MVVVQTDGMVFQNSSLSTMGIDSYKMNSYDYLMCSYCFQCWLKFRTLDAKMK